jgi:hypothetical protein
MIEVGVPHALEAGTIERGVQEEPRSQLRLGARVGPVDDYGVS